MTYEKAVTSTQYYDEIAKEIINLAGTESKSSYKPSELAKGVGAVSAYQYADGYYWGYIDGEAQGKKAQYDDFWEEYQQGGERINYNYAFAGLGWNEKTFNPKYPINIGTGEEYRVKGMFYRFNCGSSTPLDFRNYSHVVNAETFKNAQSAANLFDGARFNFLDVDLSNCTTLSACFSSGMNHTYCTDIKLKVSEKCSNFSGAFSYCSSLTNLEFKEGSVIAANIGFNKSDLLTVKSIESIFNALSSAASGKTVTFASANKTTYYNAHSTEYTDADTAWRALCDTKPNWEIVI